jgi:CheY-like chemotaxis protein
MSNPVMPVAAKRKLHILLADDDEDTLRIFSAYLIEAGYEVIHAHDGNEARELARRFHPDVVLTDNRMPIFDGITLMGMLHREEETKDIPLVLLTNDDLSLEAEKMIEDFNAIYVAKAEFKTHIWDALTQSLAKSGKQQPDEAKAFMERMLSRA